MVAGILKWYGIEGVSPSLYFLKFLNYYLEIVLLFYFNNEMTATISQILIMCQVLHCFFSLEPHTNLR